MSARPNVLPATVERIEHMLASAAVAHPDALDDLPSLEPAHFASAKARTVWEAVAAVRERNVLVDLESVADELTRRGRIEAVGLAWLAEAVGMAPGPAHMPGAAAAVREAAVQRAVLIAIDEVKVQAGEGKAYGQELLAAAMDTLSRINADTVSDETVGVGAIVRARLAELEALAQAQQDGGIAMTGLPTGVEALDRAIGGWQRGIVSIIAARPGMGKSSLGIATTDACSAAGLGVHLFSLEDPRSAYADRILARASGVPADRLRRVDLRRGEMSSLTMAIGDLRKRRHWIVDDRSGISAEDIVRSVRRHRRENETQLVIVDYLQLIKRRPDADSKHESVGDNLNVLADAAKNDGMAYVVMSQLNRGIESRADKRPQMSDMRESGTIEERAKCVVGLYRGAAYPGASPDPDIDFVVDERGNQRVMDQREFMRAVHLLVLKNSNGPAPQSHLATFDGPTTRMS